jgi:hypothetical protein
MMRSIPKIGFASLLLTSSVACSTPSVARYIYQDGEFGVVGIPINNYQKRVDYRGQAESLMARHFPEGYEIVRAEEVNEGERIRDVGRRTELETEPAVAVLNQIIRLGSLNRTTSFAEKDKLQVRECRIIYKKKSIHTPGRTGQFTAETTLAPKFYIDPNEALRHQLKATGELLAKTDLAAKAAAAGHPSADASVTPAAGVTPTTKIVHPPTSAADSVFEHFIASP